MNIKLNLKPAETIDVQVERLLRSMIKSGKLAQGQRLPPTGQLAKQWHVGRTTISKAMARLISDDLIVRKPKHGTFVKSQTDKAVIGILTGVSQTDENSHFCRALLKYLRLEMTARKKNNWTCRVYDGLIELRARTDSPCSAAYYHFVSDLCNYPFKGIIKLYGGLEKDEDAKLNPTIPRVRFGIHSKNSDVCLNMYDFGHKSLKFMMGKGLKHITYLRTLISSSDFSLDLEGLSDAASVQNPPEVRIHQFPDASTEDEPLEPRAYETTLKLIEQWRSAASAVRQPEALLISDDIAAYGVTQALSEKKIKVPEQLLVVTMANKGINHRYSVPVVKYEFPPEVVAKTLLDILCKQMAGDILPALPVNISGSINDCTDK